LPLALKQTVVPLPEPHSVEPPLLDEEELVEEELVELDVELDEEVELEEAEPELLFGIEHSFFDLAGLGSLPKVATLQVKEPLKVLNTNLSAAPKATLVDPLTVQVSSDLHIVL